MDDITRYLVNFKRTLNNEWFEKIYYEFIPKIVKYFYSKTADKQISEDLASEVFFKIYNKLDKTDLNSQSFKYWLYAIAKNQLIDYFRKNKKEKESTILTDWQQDEKIIRRLEAELFLNNKNNLKKEIGFENQRLIEAIKKLTPMQQNIIELIFIMDFDYYTVSGLLKKNQSTIRGLLFRALNTLRKEFKIS